MCTWKALSTAETGPLTCTSIASRDPPVTVNPLVTANCTTASYCAWVGPNFAVNSVGVKNLWKDELLGS